MLIQSSVATKW